MNSKEIIVKKLTDKDEIIDFYVNLLMENKIKLQDVKEKYREEVKKELDKAIYNDCMWETQF